MADTGYPSYSRHQYQPVALFPGNEGSAAFWIDGFGICHLAGFVAAPGGFPGSPSFIGGLPKTADRATAQYIAPGSGGAPIVLVELLDDAGGTGAFLVVHHEALIPDSSVTLDGITYPTT